MLLSSFFTKTFFSRALQVMLIVAEEEGSGQLVAGALNLIGGVKSAICLRACYAKSGTDIAYGLCLLPCVRPAYA